MYSTTVYSKTLTFEICASFCVFFFFLQTANGFLHGSMVASNMIIVED